MSEDMDDYDIRFAAETFRELIYREHRLVHQRITYLNFIQGFLFVALTNLWVKQSETYYGARNIVVALGAVGIVVSFSVLDATFFSLMVIEKVWVRWTAFKEEFPKAENFDPVIISPKTTTLLFDSLISDSIFSRFVTKRVFLPHCIFPLVFIVAWAVIIAFAYE